MGGGELRAARRRPRATPHPRRRSPAARSARGWASRSSRSRGSAPPAAPRPRYSTVIAHGPPRHGRKISASRLLHWAGSWPCGQRSTSRFACSSRAFSSAFTFLAVSRQPSLNSSKRSCPSTITSEFLAMRSRYSWNVSSNRLTSSQPVPSSSVTIVRGPRFFTSLISPATVTGLPPPKPRYPPSPPHHRTAARSRDRPAGATRTARCRFRTHPSDAR